MIWEIRKKKIESLLKEAISFMLAREEVKDPRISKLTTITGIKITRDLKEATVYVSCMEEEKKKDLHIVALNKAAGFIQRLVAQRVKLKSTPRLSFILDDSLEQGFLLTQKIKELHP